MWEYAGARYQGNKRASPLKKAKTSAEHVKATAKLTFPIENGFRFLPGDLEEKAIFITERVEATVKAFWNELLDWLRVTTKNPQPQFDRVREQLGPEGSETKARLHIPLHANLPDLREMGGQEMSKQFAEGFPMIDELAEPDAYPIANSEAPKLSREQLSGEAKDRAARPKCNDPKTRGIREEALRRVAG